MPKKKTSSKKKSGKAKTAKKSAGKPKVTVYSTATCPWCQKAKEYFKANNVQYKNIDVGVDEKARNEMMEKSGQFGVPVIDINGKIIVGYDVAAFKKELHLK